MQIVQLVLAFYSQLLQNGVMTRNEVRALEDLPAHTGADQLTVQLNLTPIELLGQTNEQTKDKSRSALM